MSYVTIYDAENPNLSYEIKRKAILQTLFKDNYDLASCVEPFMYDDDLFDILVEEQYILTLGGDDAVEHVNDRVRQLKDMRVVYEDYDDAINAIDEVMTDYAVYLKDYVNAVCN